MEDGSSWAQTDIGRLKLRWSDVIRKDKKDKQVKIEEAQDRDERAWGGKRPKKTIRYYIQNEDSEFVASSRLEQAPCRAVNAVTVTFNPIRTHWTDMFPGTSPRL